MDPGTSENGAGNLSAYTDKYIGGTSRSRPFGHPSSRDPSEPSPVGPRGLPKPGPVRSREGSRSVRSRHGPIPTLTFVSQVFFLSE